ncbi:hypothetical protein BCR35DRAFT_137418 [Leucosporidium creatinivorum]|uniref:Zinc finger PHD-type domain-containing protein n=1 Tax=Leucosporidium creatinivorum TaxID=106004 RepID=A0A1Y2G154_9BASI|nr:hypothetical protein BCR35DRAFT_137418 [Leucosporidium creatinivorum]
MNFGRMLNDEQPQPQAHQPQAPPTRTQSQSDQLQQQEAPHQLQHILDMNSSNPTSNNTNYSATHDFNNHSNNAPLQQHQHHQQHQQHSATHPHRAPHYTSYAQQAVPLPSAGAGAGAGPFGAFHLLSQAAQQALDPDAYLAQLNQPVLQHQSTVAHYHHSHPPPPALNLVPASQDRRSTRRASQLVSPSSSIKVVPDSDEDAEGEQDLDAEGEEDEDVVMHDREGRDSSLTSSGAQRGKSIKAEEEDVEMGTAYEKKPSVPRVPKPKAPPRPKTTRAQRKANKVKAGKARAALYGNNIKPTPPPVSHKAKSKEQKKDPSSTTNANGENDKDGLKSLSTNFPHASTSNLSSSANSPLPTNSTQAARPPFVRPAKTPLPPGPLSAPFESYAPPRGSDSEEDDLAKAWHNRRKGKGRVKVATNGQEQGEEEEEEDDRLYCICQKLYDPDRIMIACDKCENWYHLDCVEIPNDKVELVDQFIGPHCRDPSTYTITTWKSRCARPTCRKPVAPLSKYCSDYCGIEVAATRLDLCGLDAEYFWPRVVGARRREAQVFDMKKVAVVPLQTDPDAEVNHSLMDEEASRRQEEEEGRTLKRLEEKIEVLVSRRDKLEEKLWLVESRSKFLGIAIERWETLCQATADTLAAEREEVEREEAERVKEEGEEEEGEEGEGEDGGEGEETETPAMIKARERNKNKNKNKAKKKGTRRVANVGTGPTNIPEAQCGLDVRLVFDSEQWEEWVRSEEGREVLAKVDAEGGEGIGLDEGDMERVCLMPRKKCERHTGWQKVREADFDTEKSVIVS